MSLACVGLALGETPKVSFGLELKSLGTHGLNVHGSLILFQGHSVNVLTIDHVTPLHEACVGDHVACARALIDAGANVSHALTFAVATSRRSNVLCMVGKIRAGVTNEQCNALLLQSL